MQIRRQPQLQTLKEDCNVTTHQDVMKVNTETTKKRVFAKISCISVCQKSEISPSRNDKWIMG